MQIKQTAQSENHRIQRLIDVLDILYQSFPFNKHSTILIVAEPREHLQWKYAINEVRSIYMNAGTLIVRDIVVLDLTALEASVKHMIHTHVLIIDDLDRSLWDRLKTALRELRVESNHRLFWTKVE